VQRFFLSWIVLLTCLSSVAMAQNTTTAATHVTPQQERLLQQLGAAMDIMQGKRSLEAEKNIFGKVLLEYKGQNNWQSTFNDNDIDNGIYSFRIIGNTNEIANKISCNIRTLNTFPIELFEQHFGLKKESSSNNTEHFGKVDSSFFKQVYRYHYRVKFKKDDQDYLLLINFTYNPHNMGQDNPTLYLDTVSFFSIPIHAPDKDIVLENTATPIESP
jgi:uncharacterized membrane protein YkoI